jgi:pimeloyl-ACP methyl ester carboxylesterase
MLLVHSVNAAASAAEMRPLHEHYAATRTVFTPDLPGYGHSDRADRAYTPRLMTDALHAVLEQIRARCGPQPVDALAVSLGCEFLARAAVESPGAFRSLALVSATGLMGRKPRRGAPGSTRAVPGLLRALRGPGWGGALFRGLTRPGVIRYFLQRTWGSDAIDETLWQYDVLTTRQPGAEHAPLYFLSGGLFSGDVVGLYEALSAPVWLVHGVRGDFTDYGGKALFEGRWRITVLPTGALPYFECPAEFIAEYDAHLAAARAA